MRLRHLVWNNPFSTKHSRNVRESAEAPQCTVTRRLAARSFGWFSCRLHSTLCFQYPGVVGVGSLVVLSHSEANVPHCPVRAKSCLVIFKSSWAVAFRRPPARFCKLAAVCGVIQIMMWGNWIGNWHQVLYSQHTTCILIVWNELEGGVIYIYIQCIYIYNVYDRDKICHTGAIE